MGMGGKNKGEMKMNEYAVDKCFECDDFFTCDGQCDEVEGEPQTDCPKTCPSIDICTKDATDCAWK